MGSIALLAVSLNKSDRQFHHHRQGAEAVSGRRRRRPDEGQADSGCRRCDLHRREPICSGSSGGEGRGHCLRPHGHLGRGRCPDQRGPDLSGEAPPVPPRRHSHGIIRIIKKSIPAWAYSGTIDYRGENPISNYDDQCLHEPVRVLGYMTSFGSAADNAPSFTEETLVLCYDGTLSSID